MKVIFLAVWEILEIVVVAALAVFIVRTFLAQPFLVSGASMEPSFFNGDYLLIDEISYRLREPERGEVAVFKYPRDPKIDYIKRIIGLPGEKVAIENGNVKIFNAEHPEGFVLNESYLPENLKTLGNANVLLGEKEYFVMGDNRNYSYDSRRWGAVPRGNMLGLVRLRLLPITQAKVFDYSLLSN